MRRRVRPGPGSPFRAAFRAWRHERGTRRIGVGAAEAVRGLPRGVGGGVRGARVRGCALSSADPVASRSADRTSNINETSREELDVRGLKTLHQGGDWRQDSSRYDVRVRAASTDSESAARLEEFEHLLDDIGVLSEGRVAHPLGSIIPTRHNSTAGSTDAPRKSIGVSATADVWSYLLVDACLTTPGRTASKLLRWIRGTPFIFETRVLLGRLNAASSFTLANGLAVERLARRNGSLEVCLPPLHPTVPGPRPTDRTHD